MGASHEVRIGCSGWNYDDWRNVIYPEGLSKRDWLSRYAELFDTVEVNNTFYRLPSVSTVARWAEQTPPGFLFSCKASRYLTHVKRLTEADKGFERYMERLEPLRESGKLGPILWQLPANFQRHDERLAATLDALPAGRHCFEFRHPSWFVDPVYEALADHGAALVIADHPERPFNDRVLTTSWTFIRFHHGQRGQRGNYSETEIDGWKRRIATWSEDVEVFAYFNNDWEGFAPKDALRLASA